MDTYMCIHTPIFRLITSLGRTELVNCANVVRFGTFPSLQKYLLSLLIANFLSRTPQCAILPLRVQKRPELQLGKCAMFSFRYIWTAKSQIVDKRHRKSSLSHISDCHMCRATQKIPQFPHSQHTYSHSIPILSRGQRMSYCWSILFVWDSTIISSSWKTLNAAAYPLDKE